MARKRPSALSVAPHPNSHRWQFALGMMLGVVALAVAGYMTLAGLGFVEALYMTIITLSTVGYEDSARQSVLEMMGNDPAALQRVMFFEILVIVFGIGTAGYAFSVFIRSLFEGELREAIGHRRTKRRLLFMKDHYIVCGCGRMGETIAQTLRAEKIPLVVIENDPARRHEVEQLGIACLLGDATDDQTLRDAAIDKAKGLIAVTESDPENLFITLSARQLNPRLLIVSRALTGEAEQKLLRAGATRVIQPYKIGAHQLAQAALRPNVVDFIDIATGTSSLDMQIEELDVAQGSALTGKLLKEAAVLRELNLIVIAIRRAGGKMLYNPSAETPIEAADILIVLGRRDQLARLHRHLS